MESDVQIDDKRVRVTRWTLQAGEDTGEHRHEYDYVVLPLVYGRMGIVGQDGAKTTAELSPGDCYRRHAGVQHTVRNDGADALVFVEVEMLESESDGENEGLN